MGIVLFCFCDKTYIAAAKTVHLSINLAMSLTIVLVIMTGLISFQAFNNPAMREKLLFRPYFVKENGEWYRFVTHGFVHADWTHLLVNMFVLWQFGKVIESVFTSLIFGQTLGNISARLSWPPYLPLFDTPTRPITALWALPGPLARWCSDTSYSPLGTGSSFRRCLLLF
jgi:hypothetical protein